MVMPQHKNPSPRVIKFTILVDPSVVIITICKHLICLIHAPVQPRREEILHFHYMAMPQHKNPCPRDHEIDNFGRPFLGQHYYILSLSDLCLGVEKKISKEILHFHYMTYMAMTQHKNPCSGGLEICNFGRPFLGHHYYILNLSDLCQRVEKEIFKEIMHFHYMTSTAMPQHMNPYPVGHEIYNFGRPFLGLVIITI